MKLKGPLLSLQTVTRPYAEPDESNLNPPTIFSDIHLELIIPSTTRSPGFFFPFRFSDLKL